MHSDVKESRNLDLSGSELNSLELIEKFESISVEERYPFKDVYSLIKAACEKWGDDNAIEFLPTGSATEETHRISYKEFLQKIHQTANFLHGIGIKATDAVSIMLPTLPESFFSTWGAQAAAVCNPLNPMLDAHHLSEIMEVAGSKVLISLAPNTVDNGLWKKAIEVVKLTNGLTHLVLVRMPGSMPHAELPTVEGVTVVDFAEAISDQNSVGLDSKRVFGTDEPAAYMHTGGTTGRPKVAQLNHGHFAFIAQLTDDLSSNRPRYNTPCNLPLFHIFAMVISGISAFVTGRNVVVLSPSGFRNPNVVKNFWALVERFEFVGISVVPTILAVLNDVPIGEHDISSLEEVSCGAAPLPDGLKLSFEERHNCWVRNGYGMTETSCILSQSQESTPVPLGSCGLRLPYTERVIGHVVDNKLVRICGSMEAGVVLSRGPNIFAGYLEEKDDKKAWVDGWFNTGDVGYQDENGFLFLTGRQKDLIIRGGHNIDPVLIEEALISHPQVANAVAVGQPDSHSGEIPVAFVVPVANEVIDENALLEYAESNISERAAVPKRIQVIDEIPLTAVGKIFKPKLRELATEYALSAILKDENLTAHVGVNTDQLKGLQAVIKLLDREMTSSAKKKLESLPISVTIE